MFRLAIQRTLLFVLLAAAPTVFAQEKADPLGTWEWERTLGDNSMQFKLTLTAENGKLAAAYTVDRDGNPGDTREADDVKFEGNKLSFGVTRSFNGNSMTVNYEGVVSGDSIAGTTTVSFGDNDREFDWSAKRSGKAGPSWTALFDGKTLEGWERIGNEESKWAVKDGARTCKGPASMLVNTTGPYKNFRYRAECKISDGGNSGLYFRTTRRPGFMDGYEAQIDSTHTDPIRTGSLYGMCHVYQQLVKPDTWFTYELEVRDDVWRGREMTRIKITVDGNELYEYMDFEKTFKSGHFAFQHHDPESIVHIRKVEVMPLAD